MAVSVVNIVAERYPATTICYSLPLIVTILLFLVRSHTVLFCAFFDSPFWQSGATIITAIILQHAGMVINHKIHQRHTTCTQVTDETIVHDPVFSCIQWLTLLTIKTLHALTCYAIYQKFEINWDHPGWRKMYSIEHTYPTRIRVFRFVTAVGVTRKFVAYFSG